MNPNRGDDDFEAGHAARPDAWDACDSSAKSTSTDALEIETVSLLRRFRDAPGTAELVSRMEGVPLPTPAGVEVVVMPGAFHRQHAHSGADGARVLELAAALGWTSRRVPVPSFAPVAENAAILARFLRESTADRIVLVSLSKGGADVKAMFARDDACELARNVVGWLNLSGMVGGTPLVDWLRARRLRFLGIRALLLLRGQSVAALNELRREQPPPAWPAIPRHVRLIHVLGFPLTRHLQHPWARRGYARLAPLGPNDGGGILLADALHWPGSVFPLWGADHYLRPNWDVRPTLLNLLREIATAAVIE